MRLKSESYCAKDCRMIKVVTSINYVEIEKYRFGLNSNERENECIGVFYFIFVHRHESVGSYLVTGLVLFYSSSIRAVKAIKQCRNTMTNILQESFRHTWINVINSMELHYSYIC